MMITDTKPDYLYIHVPFCKTICGYCDFCHIAYQSNIADRWLEAIRLDINSRRLSTALKTVYIGGGTPSALSVSQLEKLLDVLRPYTASVKEYTIEINPECFDEERAELLQKYRINRASIGFQTSDIQLLKMMNRKHQMDDVKQTMYLLRKHGIKDISLDLMYSLPTQTMEMLRKSLQDAVSLRPTHLSLYSLTIEANTIFARKGYTHLEDDIEADMYEWICNTLPAYGYHQYEISNFAVNGHESMHNKAYWQYHDFYGIGCGASGKEGNTRYDVPKDVLAYINDPLQRIQTCLSVEDQMFESVMMGLRMKRGMSVSLFEKRYHRSIFEVYPVIETKLIKHGLLTVDGDYLACSDQGYAVLNDILLEFM